MDRVARSGGDSQVFADVCAVSDLLNSGSALFWQLLS